MYTMYTILYFHLLYHYVHLYIFISQHLFSVCTWHGLKVARVLRSGKAGRGVWAGPLKVDCVGATQYVGHYSYLALLVVNGLL